MILVELCLSLIIGKNSGITTQGYLQYTSLSIYPHNRSEMIEVLN